VSAGSAKRQPRFVFLLNRAQRVLQRWVETRPEGWEGISSAQAGVLFILASRGSATVGEIATELKVAPAAVTNLSKRMQAAGLVERMADEHDARVTRLRMTAAGEQAGAKAHTVLARLNAHISSGFSAEELATVARWLERVAELERELPGE
jgi:DNA-binding MarR family transcriptional regulator